MNTNPGPQAGAADDPMDSLVLRPDVEVDPGDVPPPLGPDEQMLMVCVPAGFYARLKAVAARRGEAGCAGLLREWMEAELTAAEQDPVTRAEALRAVEVLRKLGHLTDAA